MNRATEQHNPVCPKCGCKDTVKKGKRRNRFQTLQLFQCIECLYKFTGAPGKHRTYPLKHILESISTYNLGHSLTETQARLRKRIRADVPARTIQAWLSTYRPLNTYGRLRSAAKKTFTPKDIIRSFTLRHKQIYQFQTHKAKLQLLLRRSAHRSFSRLSDYLSNVDASFPHHLFRDARHRSSSFPAELNPPLTRKTNHATEVAKLVLPTSPSNRKRHETLQRFMLVNDSATVAVEIPVYLSSEDLAYFRSRGFNLDFDSRIITGHIDFLQVRNGYIHILDYKPEAAKEKHAHVQLTIYALALSRRVGLPLKNFKCAWFDDKEYFEFFPLQGVYPLNGSNGSRARSQVG